VTISRIISRKEYNTTICRWYLICCI